MGGCWRMDQVCKSCKGPLKAIKPNQKFCSQRCARKARFDRYVQRRALALAGDARCHHPGPEDPTERARRQGEAGKVLEPGERETAGAEDSGLSNQTGLFSAELFVGPCWW